MKYIYGLIDPRDRQIKYVGQSNDPERRHYQHIHAQEGTAKGLWIQELRQLDKLPEFILIDECSDDEAFYLENWWILIGKRQGWPLTNGTNPGEWRAQEDFKQLFDESLKSMEFSHQASLRRMENEHEQSLDRIKNEHKVACESMETESIRLAKEREREFFVLCLTLVAYVIMWGLCIFNAYYTIVGVNVGKDVALSNRLLFSSMYLAPLAYTVVHFVAIKQTKEKMFTVWLVFWLEFIVSVGVFINTVYCIGKAGL